nr:basic 7S globulin-like [Ipomoea trifida]
MDSILLSVVIIFNLVTATTSEGIPIRAPLRPNALVLPVQKDAATGLHVSKIRKGTPQQSLPFLVDLNGKFLQVNCENGYSSSTYTAPFCHSTICARAGVHYCHRCTAQASRPGCHNNTCAAIVINPLTQKTAVVELAKDVLSIQTITNQSWVDVPKFLFACASSSLLKGPLPRNVEGIVGLGHFSVSFPNQLSSHFGFSPQFSLCFTSSLAKNGAIWFGNVINGVEPRVWGSKSPLYTPLYVNSQGQYFIQVRAIRINHNPISKPSIFFSRNRGFGGGVEAIISTTTPYTILDRTLYQIFSKVFANAMSGVRQVRPVEPFGLCFDTKNFTSNVPKIHFVMQDNKSAKWTIGGAKSLVQAREGVSCLGFVDGGLMSPRAPMIIIGVHQMEDHLLEFDLARSRLGFSPPRFFNHKTCAHFNFTSTSSP